MARVSPMRSCRVWQISSTRALTTLDCLRRSRSSKKNPPAERRLKKATPSSQASTSQGSASYAREGAGEESVGPLAAALPLAMGQAVLGQAVAASGDDFALIAACCCE